MLKRYYIYNSSNYALADNAAMGICHYAFLPVMNYICHYALADNAAMGICHYAYL
jgi:hypothetical protein